MRIRTLLAAVSAALLLASDAVVGSGHSHRSMRRRAWRHYNQTCFDERERELR